MAREIKETPVLRGDDAARFEKAIQSNENKKVTPSEYIKAIKSYQHLEKTLNSA